MLNPQEVSEILIKRKSHKNVAAPTALWFGGTRGFPRERALRGTGEQEAVAVRDSTCLSQDCCWKGWVPGAPIVQVHRSPKAGTR